MEEEKDNLVSNYSISGFLQPKFLKRDILKNTTPWLDCFFLLGRNITFMTVQSKCRIKIIDILYHHLFRYKNRCIKRIIARVL